MSVYVIGLLFSFAFLNSAGGRLNLTAKEQFQNFLLAIIWPITIGIYFGLKEAAPHDPQGGDK